MRSDFLKIKSVNLVAKPAGLAAHIVHIIPLPFPQMPVDNSWEVYRPDQTIVGIFPRAVDSVFQPHA
ncbi:hypothetical protein D3C73_527670 [compost metagenome]